LNQSWRPWAENASTCPNHSLDFTSRFYQRPDIDTIIYDQHNVRSHKRARATRAFDSSTALRVLSVPGSVSDVEHDGGCNTLSTVGRIVRIGTYVTQTTRTLNPLPFQDLEPHRFEDLVRQLAYDFRHWKKLEAIGRSGDDDGIDIRGIEHSGADDAQLVDQQAEGPDEEETPPDDLMTREDRIWIIQCKREKSIGPSKARKIVADFFKNSTDKPYGYVLSAACDFSRKTRDAVRDELLRNGVEEYHCWGKGELEDQLYQPKNDNLLFAYFGISLQVRRRFMRATFRSHLALKKTLIKTIGGLQGYAQKDVLIRDSSDTEYPFIESVEVFVKNPKWRYWAFYGHLIPDHISFVTRKHFAYVNWETNEWDVLPDVDLAIPSHPGLAGIGREQWGQSEKWQMYHAYFQRRVARSNQAWAIEVGSIPYENILLCDEVGDSFNAGPHLIVEFTNGSPFTLFHRWLEWADAKDRQLEPDPDKRVKHLPRPIPDERNEFYEDMKGRTGSTDGEI